MKEAMIDSDNKIITVCPNCDNQHSLYLIHKNFLVDGYQVQPCDNCGVPYVIYLETELTAKFKVFKCEKLKEEGDERT